MGHLQLRLPFFAQLPRGGFSRRRGDTFTGGEQEGFSESRSREESIQIFSGVAVSRA